MEEEKEITDEERKRKYNRKYGKKKDKWGEGRNNNKNSKFYIFIDDFNFQFIPPNVSMNNENICIRADNLM